MTGFNPTRRDLLSLLAGALRPGKSAQGEEPAMFAVDRLMSENGGAGSVPAHRRYRAHATVTLLSIPIWSKRDAGGASVTVEQRSGRDRESVAIQFAAGSWPERAAGLNRLGMMQEVVVARGRERDAAYFGFMTSSEETSLEEGRRTIQGSPGSSITFVASQGTAGPGAAGAICRFNLPSSYRWTDWREVAREARRALAAGEPFPVLRKPSSGATFLYTVRQAILEPAPRFEGEFVHNGQVNRLCTEKSADPKRPGGIRLHGSIRAQSGRTSSFKLWLDPESVLPARIEYRPRAFLHLVFESDQRPEQPPITLFLDKETA